MNRANAPEDLSALVECYYRLHAMQRKLTARNRQIAQLKGSSKKADPSKCDHDVVCQKCGTHWPSEGKR